MRLYGPKPIDNADPERCACGCGRRLDEWPIAEVVIPTRYTEINGRYEVTGYRIYLVRDDNACIRGLVANTRDWHEAAIEDDLATSGVSLHDYKVPKTA